MVPHIREEHRFADFENTAMKRIFRFNTHKDGKNFIILSFVNLNSINIKRVNKSRADEI
jgi:hypothetical protein